MTSKFLAAYTATDKFYPEFINISIIDGKVRFAIRTNPVGSGSTSIAGNYASIDVPLDEAMKMLQELSENTKELEEIGKGE